MDKSTTVDTFDSVDALVDRVKKYNPLSTDQQACNIIINYYPKKLLRLLQNEPHTPSKWDLLLIKSINIRIDENPELLKQILVVYINRKESS